MLLFVAIQLSLHHLLEAVFFPVCILPIFVKNQMAVVMQASIWVLYSIPLIYVSVLWQVPFCFVTGVLWYRLESPLVILHHCAF